MIDMRNITPLPSGNFRVRVEHESEVLSGVVATLEEARDLRDELKRQIVDGQLRPTKGQTAKMLGPKFLGSRAGNRAKDDDSSRWHRHIATAPWAQRALGSVTRSDGAAWLKALKRRRTEPPPNTDPKRRGGRRAEKLGWQTRKHCLNLARSFFAWAIEEELISANPFVGLTVEREDGDEDAGYQEGWYLDAKEQTRFFALWDDPKLELDATDRAEKLIVQFAVGSGLRRGETWCLHLDDVHVDEGEPNPRVEVKYGSWDSEKKRYRSPKGRKGEKKSRTVFLFGLALDAARAWKAQLATYASKNPLGLMFPTERGARRTALPRSWGMVVEAFGTLPRIGRPVWWHLLRHTCASSLISGWWGVRWTLEDVSKVLGHTDVRTTQIYAHLAPSALQGAAARAHAAYLGSRHDAVTAQRPAARKEPQGAGIIGHARSDSNRRHSASKARKRTQFLERVEVHDGDVAVFCHALRIIAEGRLTAPREVLDWLESGLDWALAAAADREVRRA